MKHFTVLFQPEGKTVRVRSGAMILEAAQQAGIILNTVCGGQGTCEKCMVHLDEDEEKVLACQYPVFRDLRVYVPDPSRFSRQRIVSEGSGRDVEAIPRISKRFIHPPVTSSADVIDAFSGRADMAESTWALFHGVEKESGITALCRRISCGVDDEPNRWEVIDLESGDTSERLYGMAVDVGTTTVVAKLVNLWTGHVEATAASTNPQIRFGDDVISRIHYADRPDGNIQLQKSIANCIDDLCGQVCDSAGIQRTDLVEILAVGNTTMSHLLMGLPVHQLGQAPYRAYSCAAQERPADELGITIHRTGRIHTLENLAGFVGSDTLAVALAVGMDQQLKKTLAVDIGTNGEVLIGTREKLFACSCAAGPALEGARISQGSRAMDGAIEAVFIGEGDIDIDVIGGGAARSICGSGLIDAVAVLLDRRFLDITGRFVDKTDGLNALPEPIARRWIHRNGQTGFVLAWQGDGTTPAVVLTQKDVREMQLAKAAIRAGIRLLQIQAGMEDDQIDQVLLAGAFGNYIRRESALRIGLLPNVRPEKIHFVGNAASAGAHMALINMRQQDVASKLARQIEYVEMANQPLFQTLFADALLFP